MLNVDYLNNLIGKSRKIGLAVSGGRDSMALMHLVMQLCKDIDIYVINVDHSLRESSHTESLFVRKYCQEHNIPLYFKKLDVKSYAIESNQSIELAARVLRYQFFNELVDSLKVDKIMLAHHLDDQCETIFMRIMRGTGIRGLAGIMEIRDCFIRPLLNVSRDAIDKYIEKNSIPYIDDESNLSLDYTRNFIRHNIMPDISQLFPDYRQAVLRLKTNAQEALSFIDYHTPSPIKIGLNTQMLPITASLEPIILKNAIFKMYSCLEIYQNIEQRHLDLLLSFIKNKKSGALDMPHNTRAYMENTSLVIEKNNPPIGLDNFMEFFNSNVDTSTSFMDFTYNTITDKLKVLQQLEKYKKEKNKGNGYACFLKRGYAMSACDIDKIPANCTIRYRADNDTYISFNGVKKSLGDYFTDIKFPLRLRDKTPLLACGSDVLMIIGYEVAQSIAIKDESKNIKAIIMRPSDFINT